MVLVEPRQLVICYKSTSTICQKSKAQFAVSIKPTALCLIHFCPLKLGQNFKLQNFTGCWRARCYHCLFILVYFLEGVQARASLQISKFKSRGSAWPEREQNYANIDSGTSAALPRPPFPRAAMLCCYDRRCSIKRMLPHANHL